MKNIIFYLLLIFTFDIHASTRIKIIYDNGGNSHFDEYIYIKKDGSEWAICDPEVCSKLIKSDNNVEKFVLAMPSKTEIKAVMYRTAFDFGKCTKEKRCPGGPWSSCYGFQMKEYYKKDEFRSRGYHPCNSNFKNKKDFFEYPTDWDKIEEVLNNDFFVKYAEAFVSRSYTNLITYLFSEKISKTDNEKFKIFFESYYLYASEKDLIDVAVRYTELYQNKELPDFITKRLSTDLIVAVNAKSESIWRELYGKRSQFLKEKNYDEYLLKSYIDSFSDDKKWSSVDFENLLPKAREIYNGIIIAKQKEEEKRLAIEQKEKEMRFAIETKRINLWRKTLKIGDETHCGAIIEIRAPMIKIAVIAQIQGFGNESWLNVSNIYPPEYGCKNSSGKLSTL